MQSEGVVRNSRGIRGSRPQIPRQGRATSDEDALEHGKELIEGLVVARRESGEPLPPRAFATA